jgi:hypothetical protein
MPMRCHGKITPFIPLSCPFYPLASENMHNNLCISTIPSLFIATSTVWITTSSSERLLLACQKVYNITYEIISHKRVRHASRRSALLQPQIERSKCIWHCLSSSLAMLPVHKKIARLRRVPVTASGISTQKIWQYPQTSLVTCKLQQHHTTVEMHTY